MQRVCHRVGESKLEKYGELFVKEIVDYCKEHNVEPKAINVRDYNPTPVKIKTMKTSTLQETLELYKQNLTIEEIAQKRNLAVSTIASHIEKLILSDEEISIDKFVDIDRQEHIIRAMSILGSERLAPIKEKLGDDYSYEEIRLVRASKMSNRKIS
jgi:ATP-dependent DNA helicase RecQ